MTPSSGEIPLKHNVQQVEQHPRFDQANIFGAGQRDLGWSFQKQCGHRRNRPHGRTFGRRVHSTELLQLPIPKSRDSRLGMAAAPSVHRCRSSAIVQNYHTPAALSRYGDALSRFYRRLSRIAVGTYSNPRSSRYGRPRNGARLALAADSHGRKQFRLCSSK